MAKWAVGLTGYGIKYQPRTTIKGQALADFFVECSYQEATDIPKEIWELHTDGSATNLDVGVVLVTPKCKTAEYSIKFQFKSTNNEAEYEAEYEAGIAGLNLCKSLEAKRVVLKTDSQL